MSSYPLPDLRELATRMRRGEHAVALGGVVPGARALALAAIAAQAWPRGLVQVVVPHVADAEDLAAGLELLAPQLRVGIAAIELANPYLGAEPPLAARLQLVHLLREIDRDEIDLVIVPTRALAVPVPVPSDVVRGVSRIETGQRLDPIDLASRLTAVGYRRTDLVEEAGDFAIRGMVVDLHPGSDLGVRVQLDDDLVEGLRTFDPLTQRTTGNPVDKIDVLPLDPFPAHRDRLEAVGELLEPTYPTLSHHMSEGSERRLWWSALHLCERWTRWIDLAERLIVCDRDEVFGEIARWWKIQEREHEALCRRSMELPPPDGLLVPPADQRQTLADPDLRIETLEVADRSTRWSRLATHPVESFVRRIPDLVPSLRSRRGQDLAQVLVVGSSSEKRRFAHLLEEGGIDPVATAPERGDVAIVTGRLHHGFVWEGGLAVYGRKDLTAAPRPRRRRPAGAFASDLRDLRAGDLVVHVDHGIGRFAGFRRLTVEGREIEMLVLKYRGDDTLLVPVERADLIAKYASGEAGAGPGLDRLGGATWRRRKARVRKAVREMAAELLRLAAARRAVRGHAFSPDSPWQKEFEEAFDFDLTPDQEKAVAEIKADMESTRPMDRLLCGDVGYGKTEVAIRAAFKAVLDGKQVAVIAPTTILVEQHLDTFSRRFGGFPVEVRMLSRFSTPSEAKRIIKDLANGGVDIVIATHRLFGRDISFRDLGLVILDEEQRFGVAQKERLKHLRTEVDVIAMSATPIPRTLNMSLGGLREISLIETPPRDRQAVETNVLQFSEEVVREAILYELERGGQVYFVHNRVRSIGAFAEWLRRVVPEARVVVAHGQMSERLLERAMRRFLDEEADVLLATAIIENGLDIPNANTLLVNRADRFGLAQLYQLRGRVGRSDRLAYSYFLVPPGQPLSTSARARLAAIQEFCELGAGFRVAARDLEIRGAGNILGAEQHGFLEAVGFETYSQLLEEAIAELEGRPPSIRREVELRLGLDMQLPESYLPEPALRLSFYKRLAACDEQPAVRELVEEIVDRYGPAPDQMGLLAEAQRLRISARRAGIAAVSQRGGRWRLQVDAAEATIANLVAGLAGRVDAAMRPSGEIILEAETGRAGLAEVRAFLESVAGSSDARVDEI